MTNELTNNKYVYKPAFQVIGLPVTLSGLPDSIEVKGEKLLIRSSFHISLVCIGKIIEKQQVSDAHFTQSVIEDFNDFTNTHEIELIRYLDEFRLATEDNKRSVVVRCEVSNLDLFFEHLNKKYKLSLETPPAHVTLYTLQPDIGIFLVDSADIENLTVLIPAPVSLETLDQSILLSTPFGALVSLSKDRYNSKEELI